MERSGGRKELRHEVEPAAEAGVQNQSLWNIIYTEKS